MTRKPKRCLVYFTYGRNFVRVLRKIFRCRCDFFYSDFRFCFYALRHWRQRWLHKNKHREELNKYFMAKFYVEIEIDNGFFD